MGRCEVAQGFLALCRMLCAPVHTGSGLLTRAVDAQDAVLAVDTRVFDSNLYRLAAALPTLNSGAVRWSQATTATGRHGVVEASRIWVKVLSEMLLSRGYRQVDTARIAAFVKRLAEVSAAAASVRRCEAPLTPAPFCRAVCMQSRGSRWPAWPLSGSC